MKTELKTILHDKRLIIGLIVIILIPFFYSFFFLKSAWDPYGNTGKIPVAVVNLDQAAELNGVKIQAGADTIKKLKDDHQLDWQFVSSKAAAAGLKDNKYYTVVTIPKDFSQKAATALDQEPEQMNLQYQTNGSLNYVSEIISQVGVDKLNSQIKEAVTTAFVSQLFDQVKTIGGQLQVAADGSNQLKDGVGTLASGLTTYTDGVAQVDNGLTELNSKVPALASGISQLTDGGSQLYQGLGTLNGQIPTLTSGVQQLTSGGTQLGNGLNQLGSNVPALSSGVQQLTTGGQQLSNGLSQLNAQVPTLSGGVDQLTAGMQQIYENVVASSDQGSETLSSGISKLSQGLDDLYFYTMTERNGQPNLPTGIATMQTKMAKLLATVKSQINMLKLSSSLLTGNETKVQNATSAVQNDLTALATTVEASGDETLKSQFSQLQADYQKEVTAEKNFQSMVDSTMKIVNTSLTSSEFDAAGDPKGLLTAIQLFSDNLGVLNNELSHPEVSGHAAYSDALTQLKTGLATLNDAVNVGGAGQTSLVSGVTQLNDGLHQLQAQVPALSSGVGQLYQGSVQEAAGLESLNQQVPVLANGVGQLVTGSGQLVAGLNELNGKTPDLALGVGKLYDGSAQEYQGLEQLQSNVPTLVSGVGQLKDGTAQLVANNATINDGTAQLNVGSQQLASGLTDGAKQIAQVNLTKLTAKMFANPSKVTQKQYTKVPNYGAALAPFVLALALFIAIIIFNFMYPLAPTETETRTKWQFLRAKLGVATLFAVLMALAEATLMRLAGLQVANLAGFYGISILFGLSAMYLTMLLKIMFGNAGIFVALGLLTMSGSGGLFPSQTTASWLINLQKMLPMTYAMNGYRSAITGGISAVTVSQSILILVVVSLLCLGLMFVVTKVKLKAQAKTVTTTN